MMQVQKHKTKVPKFMVIHDLPKVGAMDKNLPKVVSDQKGWFRLCPEPAKGSKLLS